MHEGVILRCLGNFYTLFLLCDFAFNNFLIMLAVTASIASYVTKLSLFFHNHN